MRYFPIDPNIISDSPDRKRPSAIIKGSDVKHIRNVLRLTPGNIIGLLDGAGYKYEAEIESLTAREVHVRINRRIADTSRSPVRIMLAQALLKDKKMDVLVRQLTELGISDFIPYHCSRCVPRPAPRQFERRRQRWQKITREALKQCGASQALTVHDLKSYDQVLQEFQSASIKIVFYEKAGHQAIPGHPTADGANLLTAKTKAPVPCIIALLGPEGGFTSVEIQAARRHNFLVAGLGPRILRAETATLSACVLLQHRFGDLS